ncbi:hypothetical protein NBG4_110042 [Candidatus Sulfobium mesophilum]|uniref:histidine kinase n=1 Tax=Candidatus Sulfobium mesophilum TaxID=2016548 RepID=A0A2U3QEI4_9BACT|nr:hypothetical protein NBG4_110042 [Candidatus Sulfobium mesophilum]
MHLLLPHISDTGPGIPAERLPLIFEPFHTTKEIGRGTGLGLSIRRKIIEEHGGFIKAENRKAGGLERAYTSLIKARRASPKYPTGNSWGAGGI